MAEKRTPKAPRKRVKPWLYWDAESERLKARKDDPRYEAFTEKWGDLLGNVERLEDEEEKAMKWLRENPTKRAKIKSFEQFLRNWLRKLVEE
jgi:hypothetical protein